MSDELITYQDLTQALRRHGRAVAAITVACLILGGTVFAFVPRRYKAISVLSIKNSYFQLPMDSEMLSGAREGSEMLAEKQNIIQRALDDSYLNEFGERFQVYKSAADAPQRAGEREKLRKKIEIISTNPTTFQFSMTAGDPDAAVRMNLALLDRVSARFVEGRQNSLGQYRASLKRQLDTMGMAGTSLSNPALAAQPELLEEQLQTVQTRLSVMRERYSDSHPAIQALENEASALRNMIRGAKGANGNGVRDPGKTVLIAPGAKDRPPLYDEIVKKINSVDIVLELEKNPQDVRYLEIVEPPKRPATFIFPNPKHFILGSLFVALALSSLLVGYRELKRAAILTAEAIASALDVPLLGVLPTLVTPGGDPDAVYADTAGASEVQPSDFRRRV